MLLRWFRLVYTWFLAGSVICTPLLMALYYVESERKVLKSNDGVLGMKRFTLATAGGSLRTST
jgi:hypothetical protein